MDELESFIMGGVIGVGVGILFCIIVSFGNIKKIHLLDGTTIVVEHTDKGWSQIKVK